jgi:gamma-F420-2:alpha-L-glutamate ligase
MQLIQTTNKSANIILQEYIKESHSMDLRVLMVGNKLISVMKRTSANGNFKANYSIGGRVTKFEVTSEIELLSKQIMKVLDLDVAGIDLLFARNGYKICEVNSAPGFQGMESCCNVNVAEEMILFVKQKVAFRC